MSSGVGNLRIKVGHQQVIENCWDAAIRYTTDKLVKQTKKQNLKYKTEDTFWIIVVLLPTAVVLPSQKGSVGLLMIVQSSS